MLLDSLWWWHYSNDHEFIIFSWTQLKPMIFAGRKWNAFHKQLYLMLVFQYLFYYNIFNRCLMTWHNVYLVMCIMNENLNISVIPSSSKCYLKAAVPKDMPGKIISVMNEWLPLLRNCRDSWVHRDIEWHLILKARQLEMCFMLVQ